MLMCRWMGVEWESELIERETTVRLKGEITYEFSLIAVGALVSMSDPLWAFVVCFLLVLCFGNGDIPNEVRLKPLGLLTYVTPDIPFIIDSIDIY